MNIGLLRFNQQHRPVSPLPNGLTGPLFGSRSSESRGMALAVGPVGAAGELHFGIAQAAKTSATDPLTQKQRNNILLPPGVPIFYLHGMSVDGTVLAPIKQFVHGMNAERPGFISSIPEVKNSSGIESVLEPDKTLPAYQAALKDLGSFRYQVVNNRIHSLRKILEDGGQAEGQPTGQKEKRLAEFFSLLPDARSTLLPLLQTHLIDPVFSPPKPFETVGSLAELADKNVGKIYRELKKLKLKAQVDQPIVDTHTMSAYAGRHGKTINIDSNMISDGNDVLNLRPISFHDIAMLELYVMYVRKNLARALYKSLKGKGENPKLRDWAHATATKLMDQIAPRTMVFGHSQGGVTLMSSLLNYLEQTRGKTVQQMLANPEAYETCLAGRGIGMAAFFSAPLSGVPDEPAWGKTLLDFFGSPEQLLTGKEGDGNYSRRAIRWVANRTFTHDSKSLYTRFKYPAIPEMRTGSSLIAKIRDKLLSLVEGKQLTLISVYDKEDSFVEPAAARFPQTVTAEAPNIFDIELDGLPTPQFDYKNAKNILQQEFVNLSWDVGPVLGSFLFNLPDATQKWVHKKLVKMFPGLWHHRALLDYPTVVHDKLGQELILDPDRQLKSLNPENFEPYRYQSLIVRRKLYDRHILNRPTGEAIAALQAYWQAHPAFLPKVLANARENLPVSNAASTVAQTILGNTLDLFEKVLADPQLKETYRDSLKTALSVMAQEKPVGIPLKEASADFSSRAGALLKQLRTEKIA